MHRDKARLYAWVKGCSSGHPGEWLDTVYGQLLRRIPLKRFPPDYKVRVVVPTGAEVAALRLSRRVRELLQIDIYVVSDHGQVGRWMP